MMKTGNVYSFVRLLLAVSVLVLATPVLASASDYDLVQDGSIDWKDLDAFADEWLNDCNAANNWCNGANFNSDNNSIDFDDFGLFAKHCFIDPNLVGWWKFEEGSGDTARDSSGNDNHGILYGEPNWVAGEIGSYALDFNGTDDHVEIASDDSLNVTDEITIGVWAKPAAYSGELNSMVQKWGNVSNRRQYLLTVMNGKVRWYISTDGADYPYVIGAEDIPTDEWTHIVGMYDNSKLKIYVNGSLDNEVSQSGSIFSSDVIARIGGYGPDSETPQNRHFDGVIDDARIYNRALSEVEVRDLAGLGGQAWNPDPSDGAGYVDKNAVLSWSAAEDALSHDVYFGTNFDDVNDANNSWPVATGPNDPNVYKGNQAGTTYDPCGLEVDTTYYWRIDEVIDTDICKGDVWRFTTVGPPVAGFFAVPRSGWDIYYTAEFVSISIGDITSYEWNFGDGNTSLDLVASHKYASPGTYTVSLTVTGPGGSDTMTKDDYITVNDFDDYPYSDYNLAEPNQVLFDAALDAIEIAGGGRILFDFSNQTVDVNWDARSGARRDFFGNNLIIDGQDKNVTFYYSGDYPCNQDEGGPCLRIHGNDNIVRNFTWDAFPDGLHMRGGYRNLHENITVNIVCEDAMTWNGSGNYCIDCVIRDCTFGPSGDKTIMINSWDTTKGRCVITGCYSYNGNQPIRSSTGGLLTVRNCEFAGSSSSGPRFGGSDNLIIFENNYSHGTKSGLRLSDSASAIVRNNTLHDCRDRGVWVYSSSNVFARMEGNTITDNNGDEADESGVYVGSGAQVDMGGGSVDVHRNDLITGPGTDVAPSQGGNTLTGNSPYDLRNASAYTVKAERNFWDYTTVGDVLQYDVFGNVDVDPLGTP